MLEKILNKFGYIKIKHQEYRNHELHSFNCSFSDCPMFDAENEKCKDSIPVNVDVCWFLRWAETEYKKKKNN
jgi:hypothetical protein